MTSDTKIAEQNDHMKKPYQAPKLVVMGGAAEITQANTGLGIDGISSPTAAVS